MTTYNNTTQRREPTCDKCNTPMHTRRVHRFSGCITLIGYVLTLPFFLAVLIGLMGIVVGAVSTADKACEVATTAVAISLMLGVEFIIPFAIGLYLVRMRLIWLCPNCAHFFERYE